MGVVRLLLVKTREWSGCFWQEQGCGQAASGENEDAVRLFLARTRVCQAASSKNKGVVRLLLVRTRVRSGCFW